MENKKNDFDFVKNIIAINKAKNSPADLRKLLKQAIKEETYSVFSSLCDEFNNPQLGLDETEVWGTLLKSGNITLLENVLKHNHSLTLKNIQKLQLTFTEYRKKNQLSKEMLDRFLNIIHKTDAYVSSKNKHFFRTFVRLMIKPV